MSDNGSDLPHIPYSRLRELKHHAEMVVAAVAGGGFTGSDLWRIYVGLEVNALTATYWYEKWERAHSYSPFSAAACPLCSYEDGVFTAPCNYHKQIDGLLKTVKELENRAQEKQSNDTGSKGQGDCQ